MSNDPNPRGTLPHPPPHPSPLWRAAVRGGLHAACIALCIFVGDRAAAWGIESYRAGEVRWGALAIGFDSIVGWAVGATAGIVAWAVWEVHEVKKRGQQ
jgi:hypothetical protein